MGTIVTKYIEFLTYLSRVTRNPHRHGGRFRQRHSEGRRLNHGLQHIERKVGPDFFLQFRIRRPSAGHVDFFLIIM